MRRGREMLREGRGGGRFASKGGGCGVGAILPPTRRGPGAERAARLARAPGRLCRRVWGLERRRRSRARSGCGATGNGVGAAGGKVDCWAERDSARAWGLPLAVRPGREAGIADRRFSTAKRRLLALHLERSASKRQMWSQSRHDPPEGLKAADLVAKQCRRGEVAGSVLQDVAGHY